jgi:hypothetical protein
MRRSLPLCVCCLFFPSAVLADELMLPDGSPARLYGGLQIFRRGNQTVVSLGGGVFGRRVNVTTDTPEGPVVTQFRLPSNFHSPQTPPIPNAAPAMLRVQLPDADGVLYVAGELVRSHGTARPLQSPPLPLGQPTPLHVRAAFRVGDRLLIEDKRLLLWGGQTLDVTFDGAGAVAVPLPRPEAEVAPPPRPLRQ